MFVFKMTNLSTGTLPLVMTSDVSPGGNHSVRIVDSSSGEDTVPYFINDAIKPSGKFTGVYKSWLRY